MKLSQRTLVSPLEYYIHECNKKIKKGVKNLFFVRGKKQSEGEHCCNHGRAK